MLGTNDAPNHLASCKCTRIDDDEPATFDCAVIECPEDFGDDYCSEDCTPTIEPNHTLSCISTYENVTSICRSKKICGIFNFMSFCSICLWFFIFNCKQFTFKQTKTRWPIYQNATIITNCIIWVRNLNRVHIHATNVCAQRISIIQRPSSIT